MFYDMDTVSADFAHFIALAVPVSDRSSYSSKEWATIERCARSLYIGVRAAQTRSLIAAAKAIKSVHRHAHKLPINLQRAYSWISAILWDPVHAPACFEEQALSA